MARQRGTITWLHVDQGGRLVGLLGPGRRQPCRFPGGRPTPIRLVHDRAKGYPVIMCGSSPRTDGAACISVCLPAWTASIQPTGRVRHYTTADGLTAGELLSAFRDRSGTLWFGGYNGLLRLVPTTGSTEIASCCLDWRPARRRRELHDV